MERLLSAACGPVTEVPGVTHDGAVGIHGGGAIEQDGDAHVSTVRPAGIGHRRRRHDDGGRGGGAGGEAVIVGHCQGHGIDARRGVGVGGRGPGAGGAVAEVPGIADDGAVRIRRARAVHLHSLADDTGVGSACIGHRWLGCRRCGDGDDLGIGARGPLVVGHGEGDGVGARRGIHVVHLDPGAGGAVAEVPGIGHDGAVGIVGASPVEGENLARLYRIERSDDRHRRLVDRGHRDGEGGGEGVITSGAVHQVRRQLGGIEGIGARRGGSTPVEGDGGKWSLDGRRVGQFLVEDLGSAGIGVDEDAPAGGQIESQGRRFAAGKPHGIAGQRPGLHRNRPADGDRPQAESRGGMATVADNAVLSGIAADAGGKGVSVCRKTQQRQSKHDARQLVQQW